MPCKLSSGYTYELSSPSAFFFLNISAYADGDRRGTPRSIWWYLTTHLARGPFRCNPPIGSSRRRAPNRC